MDSAGRASDAFDTVIVGAGAAGLAASIVARRHAPDRRVLLVDGASRLGAKILVSGGSRCNVTNRIVTEADFWGGRRTIVRRVLRAFSAGDAAAFFRDIGVSLREEADGKLFPDTNRARDVLAALLREVAARGVELRTGHRVHAVEREGDSFRVDTSAGAIAARRVVLATGGQSLPKSGSDGAGFDIARHLGHTIVPTTPGLVPLVLDTAAPAFPSGVSHEVEIAVWVDGRVSVRLRGSLLWTHFGISGPVALNASRHWLRAGLEQRATRLTLSFTPDESFETLDSRWRDAAAARPRLTVGAYMATGLPASIAATLLERLGIDGHVELARFSRDARRRLVNALTEWPLPVTGSRGYNYAEVTAGGVALGEIDPATMASRRCPGLYLVGEILDVDGRIGGFNFQWAWSSAYVAGRALGS